MGRAQYDDYYEEEYEYEYEDDFSDSREPSPYPPRRQQASSRAPIPRRRENSRSPRRGYRDRDDPPPRRRRDEPDRYRDRDPSPAPPRQEQSRRPPDKDKEQVARKKREESRKSLDEDFWKASPPPKREEQPPRREEARRPPPRDRGADPPGRRQEEQRPPPKSRDAPQARRPPPREKEAPPPTKEEDEDQEGSSASCSRSRSPPRKRASNFADAPVEALALATEPPKQDAPFVLYHNRKRQEPTKAQTFAEPAPSYKPIPAEPVSVGVTMDVQPALVPILMTSQNCNLLRDETKADIEWKPAEGKVLINGAPEHLEKAKKIINRVMTHSCWGVSADKVRRLLTPRRLESALVRLSPMENLPSFQKLLSPASPTITLGKGPTNEVVLPNPHGVVSRNHCIIELDPDRGAIYAHDCSTNGSFLNGIRLPAQQGGKVLLSHGDELLFTDPGSGIREFGYIVNINEMSVKEETKIENLLPRRLQTDMDR
eukprot:CAMPEP_0197638426 /NCGR_PEP_ID=MMETSP1338-20131121/13360_1 /TAXON_ID=43686 ORGANISM="Pelagodinium beii, Strain RCC1491" /NCGR_SAMPLE_ID=MMETSP1338 /ASSEMBLY_ACC=CAM_ASM_000754 /LENGTH=485 /DNA_ID=CAMNT_0043211003 /DNA_START=31 /DNA_END=1485 /DNA_ORIENTATION=-